MANKYLEKIAEQSGRKKGSVLGNKAFRNEVLMSGLGGAAGATGGALVSRYNPWHAGKINLAAGPAGAAIGTYLALRSATRQGSRDKE